MGNLVGDDRIQHLLTRLRQFGWLLPVPFLGLAALAGALVVAEQGAAMTVLHAVEEGWRDLLAAIDESRVALRHIDQVGITGAERHGRIGRQLVIDAETFRQLGNGFHADILCHARSDLVEGFLKRDPQRDHAVGAAFGIVGRAPIVSGRHIERHERRVQHARRRRVSLLKGSSIDEGLEARPRLALGLGDAVIAALEEGIATLHG